MLELKGKYCKDLKIFTDNVEEEAISQLYGMCESKGFNDKKIRIMPDCHSGKGCVIGTSYPINVDDDFLSPNTVGVDIGCEVSMHFYDREMPRDKYAEFEHKIRKEIPFGFNVNESSRIDEKTIIKRFQNVLQRLCSSYPIFSQYEVAFKTEKDLIDWCNRLHMDYGTFLKSIGSVGGGNHFIEYDENMELGKYGVCVHCGSRNLGQKVCGYWDKMTAHNVIPKQVQKDIIAKVKEANADKTKLKEEIDAALNAYRGNHVDGFLDGDQMRLYLIDMCLAQEYARINHEIIHSVIDGIYEKLCGGKKIDEIYTTHNYVDFDFESLLGHHNIMVRKGAVRAYEGEELIIPFNMMEGLSICEGKSNEEWNCTAPHGCGRLLSRAKAKETLNVDDFQRGMADADVYTTTADLSILDEAPMAYKSKDEIISLIEPTVSVKYFMIPKINIKASEEVPFWRKK